MRLNIDMDWLLCEYRAGRSASELSKELGCSVWSVITRLRKAGVRVRSQAEQDAKYLGQCTAPFTFREIVDGILLGDGQIDPKGTLHLEQTNRRAGWLAQVAQHLDATGCATKQLSVAPRVRVIEGREVRAKAGTHLYTPAYKEMQAERLRWYNSGVKKVPKDLTLTSFCLLHWFCGDGSFSKTGSLYFATHGFQKRCVDYLCYALKRDLDVVSTAQKSKRKGQFIVNIVRRNEALKIKDLLAPIIDPCCMYKLMHVRPRVIPGGFTDDQVREIRARRARGEQADAIAKDYGVTYNTVRNIAARKAYRSVE